MSAFDKYLNRRDFLTGAAKLGAGLGLGAVGLSSLSGCQAAEEAEETGKPIVAIMVDSLMQARWSQADIPWFDTACKEEGLISVSQNAQADVKLQASQVENLITMGVSAVALSAVESSAGTEMVKKFNEAGIPVIAYNYAIPDADVDYIIARDPYLIGQRLAAKALEDVEPTGNWAKISGDQGTDVARLTTEGIMDSIQPYIDSGDINLVAFEWHPDFSGDLAMKTAEEALVKADNDVKAWLCDNDGMGYGVIRALEAVGKAGESWVCGVDAEIEACRQILLGNMAVSNWSWFDRMGYQAGKILSAIVKGEEYPTEKTQNNGLKDVPWVVVENMNVSRENMVEWLPQVTWWAPAKSVVKDVPEDLWPEGLKELVGA